MELARPQKISKQALERLSHNRLEGNGRLEGQSRNYGLERFSSNNNNKSSPEDNNNRFLSIPKDINENKQNSFALSKDSYNNNSNSKFFTTTSKNANSSFYNTSPFINQASPLDQRQTEISNLKQANLGFKNFNNV